MINYFKNKQIGHQKGYGLSGVAGFTLVEILIVISIIATMATFAVTRLNPLRNKAKDTSIKISLAALRSVAEINYDTLGNYTYICSNNKLLSAVSSTATEPLKSAQAQVVDIYNKISKQTSGDITCNTGVGVYAVSVPLLFADDKSFCIDSNGFSDETSVELGDETECKLAN